MKLFILIACLSAQFFFASPRILPKKFPEFCPLSTPNYSRCMEKAFSKMGPMLLKGVREIKFPRLHPLEISTVTFNRSINNVISLAATMKNIQFWGYNTLRLESFDLDTETLEGQIHLFIPELNNTLEFDFKGNMFGVNLDSAGLMSANSRNIDLLFIFKLKKFNKLGVDYYGFEKFIGKSTIGDSDPKMVSRDPKLQPAVDAMLNMYNQNHRRVLDAINPIYEEIFQEFYRSLAEQVLANIPADELTPP